MSILGEPDCERMQRGLQWIRQIRIPFKNCPTKNWFNVQRVFVPIAATMFQKHQRSHRRRVWLTASYGSVCPDMYGHHHRRPVARCVLWPAGQWHAACYGPQASGTSLVAIRLLQFAIASYATETERNACTQDLTARRDECGCFGAPPACKVPRSRKPGPSPPHHSCFARSSGFPPGVCPVEVSTRTRAWPPCTRSCLAACSAGGAHKGEGGGVPDWTLPGVRFPRRPLLMYK